MNAQRGIPPRRGRLSVCPFICLLHLFIVLNGSNHRCIVARGLSHSRTEYRTDTLYIYGGGPIFGTDEDRHYKGLTIATSETIRASC